MVTITLALMVTYPNPNDRLNPNPNDDFNLTPIDEFNPTSNACYNT